MSTISIIGSGTMATAIGGRMAKTGHTVELISRDTGRAQALADKLASEAITGTYGAAPAGDIVILAVPYASAAADFGDGLDGKVIIDITNPVVPDLSGLVTPHGSCGAQETAKALPAGAHVVKAFNTIFGHVLAKNVSTRSSQPTMRTPRRRSRPSSKVSGCARSMSAACRWPSRSNVSA
jgi:predicted dinucleotide-binding enzyme